MPVPRTWTVGELLTASKMNADVRNGLNFLLSGKPLAILTRSSIQNFNHNTPAPVTWNSEVIDRDGGHDNVTNPTRYTAQTAGWYNVTAMLNWVNFAGGSRYLGLNRSGAAVYTEARGASPASYPSVNLLAVPIFLSLGDYVTAEGMQDSGSTINIQPGFSQLTLEWVSTA
ncbi:hypothetical protein [Nonomuraea sp. NPDC049758]|uniref:hypothetical protein n=1 Tax=Nonomuraea sp. NPDC049758 TaxID=3154360 RepID=UPI0034448EEF